jgi:hypothetical protein
MTAIDASRLSALETYADIVTESEMVESLHSLTWEAFQIEIAKLYDRSHELLAKDGETVQMLGRLGYGPLTKPAPRWPLEAKLLNG